VRWHAQRRIRAGPQLETQLTRLLGEPERLPTLAAQFLYDDMGKARGGGHAYAGGDPTPGP